ncbi:MAG: hypothetical protein AAGD11_17275 [Planctomycetota bacterium]
MVHGEAAVYRPAGSYLARSDGPSGTILRPSSFVGVYLNLVD